MDIFEIARGIIVGVIIMWLLSMIPILMRDFGIHRERVRIDRMKARLAKTNFRKRISYRKLK